nr:unnamed protein product [Callosobruchus analis]
MTNFWPLRKGRTMRSRYGLNPSNGDIMKALNIRFKDIEKALNFNGDKMEELQKDLRSVIEENKQMKKEQ